MALAGGERLQLFQWSPSGNAAVYVLDNDVFYLATVTATPWRVSVDGEPGVLYNGVADWVYEGNARLCLRLCLRRRRSEG